MTSGMTAELHLRALFDPDAFAEEQARLGRIWTLVGFASDIPRENDWFRTVLGGCSIFIQRFAEGLRGFENRCAHRSYPLRTAERGNGPILCGFHHWRYNSAGAAVGIPVCQDAFGTTPAGLNKRLTLLDVACCGDLIFARFPGRDESLESFLGPCFDVISILCASMGEGRSATLPGRMNWRLSQWISMDEYHLAAVHATTLAVGKSYLRRTSLNYERCGVHSAYFLGQESGTIADWAGMLRRRESPGPGYRILHLFPNASIAFLPAIPSFPKGRLPFSYVILQRHIPTACDGTELEMRVVPAPQRHLGNALLPRLLAPFEAIRLHIVSYGFRRVLREDQEVCENLQRHARQIAPDPIYGASEARVGWFNEAYAEAMRASAPS